jgi:hypothetical protein
VSARRAWAEVDLGAVRHNAALLAELAAPAALCAVVKAAGYGHGSVAVARAALEGGATWLAVAIVEEGEALRRHDIDAPVLLLSEPPAAAMDDVVALALTPPLYTERGVEAAAKAVASAGAPPLDVHVKVDTGMHRVGVDPDGAVAIAQAVAERPELNLAGLWTHFAVADEPGNAFTEEQCARFAAVIERLDALGLRPPPWPSPPPTTTWCAVGSPSTGSPRARPWPRSRPSPGSVRPCPCGPGCRMSAGSRRARRCPTASAGRWSGRAGWPPFPWVTPTACRGGSG